VRPLVTVQARPPSLDVRGLAPASRDAAVLAAFDRLLPGDTLLLVNAVDPRDVLGLLRHQRKGRFEWSPTRPQPGTCVVEIVRRRAPPGSRRRVTEALEWEHHRIDVLGEKAFLALDAGRPEEAQRLYAAFHHGLARHIQVEEELLFPVFEMRTGLPHGGPTSVLRAEHEQVGMILGEIARDLGKGGRAVDERHQALRQILNDHNRKEELILYPGTDRLLTAAESDALVACVQSFPA